MRPTRYLPFAARVLRRRGAPLHLTLFVTGRCNARCRHCFHWREVRDGVEGPSAADVDRLAASCGELGPLLWVSFGGGEPFLRDDLADLAKSFGSRGLRHLAIPTNGLVEGRQLETCRRILAENPDLVLSVSVSFDGPEEIHDSIRQVPGGHRRSRDSVRALLELAREEPRLGVGILLCVTSENQHVLADHLEELVDELHPHNVTVNLARGTAMESHLLEVDPDRYAEVVARKQALQDRGRLPYFDFPLAGVAVERDRMMYEHVERLARGDRSKHLPCTAGEVSAVVFENGDVRPCEILGDSLGNLNEVDWDLGRLWREKEADGLRARIRDTRCACTFECAQADNVLFRARSWPRLIRGALRR